MAGGPLPRVPIGDDAAVLRLKADREWLITTDLLVEGSHFRRRHPAAALGHKALARGLSDIAAMGGRPCYALLSLCLPRWVRAGQQRQFFAGLFRLARRAGVTLVGGDLAAGDRLVADIVVLGSVRRGRAMLRSAAKPGDLIYVSGRLGGSALGWKRLASGAAARRHLYPEPRLELGRFLAERLKVRAAMDLSDGLSLDLYRLAKESHVGAEIRRDRIPVFPGASLDQALHGGEDYELLFTLDPRRKAPASFRGIPLTPIGRVTARRHLMMVDAGGRKIPLKVRGFQHRL